MLLAEYYGADHWNRSQPTEAETEAALIAFVGLVCIFIFVGILVALFHLQNQEVEREQVALIPPSPPPPDPTPEEKLAARYEEKKDKILHSALPEEEKQVLVMELDDWYTEKLRDLLR